MDTLCQIGGKQLRTIRGRLKLTLRDVEQSSRDLARQLGDNRYYLPASRLSGLENNGISLSIYRLFSLSVIYDLPILRVLELYGVDAYKREDLSASLKHLATHPADLSPHQPEVPIPIRIDPAFSARMTQLLNRFIQEWRNVPLEILEKMRFDQLLYIRIGQDDNLMFPLLRPGCIVQVDATLKEIESTGWSGEHDQPLYAFATHDGYRCAWCRREGRSLTLTLMPHPGSGRGPETYQLGRDIEILGRVTGIWMNLTAPAPR